MTAEELSQAKIKCSECYKEFKYESERRRHELSHSPQFQCHICSKKFSFVSALRRHEKQHNRTGSVHCSQCGGKFRDEILLKRHMNYAHKGTYKCKKCSSSFNSEVALHTHAKTHKPEEERKYRCSFNGCNKTFNFQHHLKHHELTHTNRKQHYCTVCSKGFIQLHHLKTHMKRHDPENWLECIGSNCNKKFPTEYAMKRHLLTHENTLDSKSKCKVKSVIYSSVKLKDTPKDTAHIKKEDPRKSTTNVHEKDENNKLDSVIVKLETNVSSKTKLDNKEIVADCKTALGDCLMNSDFNGNDCLCAQMIHNNEEPYDLTPVAKKNIISKEVKFDVNLNLYDGCECSSFCNVKKVIDNTYDFNKNVLNKKRDGNCDSNKTEVLSNIEYGVDGVVKLKNTFDIDISLDLVVNKELGDNKLVPYNTCKEVLGKCIVSGNGTISENCLCARMHFDELQMLAEEVQDIIPQPNNPQFGNFVI